MFCSCKICITADVVIRKCAWFLLHTNMMTNKRRCITQSTQTDKKIKHDGRSSLEIFPVEVVHHIVSFFDVFEVGGDLRSLVSLVSIYLVNHLIKHEQSFTSKILSEYLRPLYLEYWLKSTSIESVEKWATISDIADHCHYVKSLEVIFPQNFRNYF